MWWIPVAFAGGDLRIELEPGSPPYSAVEVRCGAWRDRADVVERVATLTGLPADAACTAYFKGNTPSRTEVAAGQQVQCRFRGIQADCRTTIVAVPPPPSAARVVLAPNVHLPPDAPPYSAVHVSCRSPRFEADAPVVDRSATVPGLPDAPCTATFSYPPPLTVAVGARDPGPANAPAAVAPPPPPVTAPLTVTVHGGGPVSAIEVVCPSGYRVRAPVTDGGATVPDVPVEECRMYLKGVVGLWSRVSGGESKTCVTDGRMVATCS
jgi:hypothetical protein